MNIRSGLVLKFLVRVASPTRPFLLRTRWELDKARWLNEGKGARSSIFKKGVRVSSELDGRRLPLK